MIPIKVNTLNLLSRNYSYINDTQNVRKFASEALTLAEKLDFLYGIGYAFQNLGQVSERADDFTGSRELYNKALNYFCNPKTRMLLLMYIPPLQVRKRRNNEQVL